MTGEMFTNFKYILSMPVHVHTNTTWLGKTWGKISQICSLTILPINNMLFYKYIRMYKPGIDEIFHSIALILIALPLRLE